MQNTAIIPLADATPRQKVVLRDMSGSPDLLARLRGLGMILGAVVYVIQNRRKGPLMLKVNDTKLAIGRAEAKNILVETSDV